MSAHNIAVSPSAYTYPLLIKQLLYTPLARAAEQEIVYRDTYRGNYRSLRERIGRLANGLQSLGLAPGQTVAVMDWDSHRYLECFFAVPMMGAVLQTVNVRLSPEQILYTLNHAQADVVLVNSEFLPMLAIIRDKLESVKKFVLISDSGATLSAFQIPFAAEYEELLAAASPAFEFPDFDENTRATTFYTTGTTGLPKGVYFSHRQLVLHTLAVATALGTAPRQGRLHTEDVYMPITPMFHVHAWGLPYVATLLGIKQVYPGRYMPDSLLRLIEKEKVTFSHCVPTIMHMLLSSPLIKEIDLKGWKVIIGGAALPRAMAQTAMDLGIDAFTGYGMSETCPILTFSHLDSAMLELPAEEQAALRAKTGRAIPLVDLRTVDGHMADVVRDAKSTGEVVARAPWLTQGYLHNAAASETLWDGGYLHTNDIGHFNAAGYLQITDRIKDVIKTGGEWISSLELEDLIIRHPAVSEVAVIGVKDDKWGERPMALVVLRSGATVTADEIREHVKAYADKGIISRYGVPDQIQFLDSLTKTSVGKLNKKAMREQFGGQS